MVGRKISIPPYRLRKLEQLPDIMFSRLLLIFIVVPLLDLALLMVVSKYTSVLFTLALVIISGVVGATLAHRQIFQTGVRIRKSLAENRLSGEVFSDGAMILFAAGLLITPGLITDLVGFSLLVPACRRWYRKRLSNWFRRHFDVRVTQYTQTFMRATENGDDIVEGHVVRDGDPSDRPDSFGRSID